MILNEVDELKKRIAQLEAEIQVWHRWRAQLNEAIERLPTGIKERKQDDGIAHSHPPGADCSNGD